MGCSKWDVIEYLGRKEDVCYYLEATAEEARAMAARYAMPTMMWRRDVVRAQDMGRLSRDINLNSDGIRKELSEIEDISQDTIAQIAEMLSAQPSVAT